MRPASIVNALVLVILVAAAGWFSIYVGQDKNHDLINYHLYNSYAFLNNRLLWDLAPAGIHSYFNPLGNILHYVVFVGLADFPRVVAFLASLWTGLSAFVLYRIAASLFEDSRTRLLDAGLSILVGMTGAAGVSQVGLSTNEWQPALLYFVGLLFVLRALRSHEPDPWDAGTAGVLIGLATGIKLTAISYAIGATAGLFVVGLQMGQLKRLLIPFCVGGAIGFLILGGPWCIVLYLKFGNPFFPFFNGIFRSEWFDAVSISDQRFFPRNIWQWLFYPVYWAFTPSLLPTELWVRDPRIAFGLLSSVVILVFSRRMDWHQRYPWQFIAIAYLVSYLVWLLRFSIYRYVIPLEVLAGPLIVGAVYLLVRHRIAKIAVAASISAGIVAITVAPDWGRIPFGARTWELQRPDIPPGSLIVLGGGGPMSALLPFFPPDARFVRGFAYHGPPDRMVRTIDEAVRSHTGPLFTLRFTTGDRTADNVQLNNFGLTKIDSECAPIKFNLMPSDPTEICPLRRR